MRGLCLPADPVHTGRAASVEISVKYMKSISVLAALLLVLFLATVIVRWFWRKGVRGRAFLGVLAGVLAWNVHGAMYPDDSFYVAEFQHLSTLTLPSTVEFLEKQATFPDIFGDYTACFIVRISSDGMNSLLDQLDAPQNSSGKPLNCNADVSDRTEVPTQIYEFDLSTRATREDATISISLAPDQNLAKITWSLW